MDSEQIHPGQVRSHDDPAGPSNWRETVDCGTTVDLIEDLVHDTRRRQRRRLSSEAVRRRKLDPNEKLSIPFKRRAPRKPGACNITAQNPSALSVLFLALLSTTSAAPPPTRPLNHLPSPFRSSPTTPPVPRRYEVDDKVHIVTTAPSDIPTAVLIVDETALPYVLTQVQDGSWSKIDDAWFLYGRQAGSPQHELADGIDRTDRVIATHTGSPSPSTSTWAVEAALPSGWGRKSNRTSFYKVPLIVTASVILAIGISIGVIFLVVARRKADRRRQRRAERMRRKALSAAGLSEKSIKGSAAEAALKEKLAELEEQNRTKKGKEMRSSFVKVKVRKWNGSLRRRKGKLEESQAEIKVIEEILADAGGDVVTPDSRRRSTESLRSVRTVNAARLADGGVGGSPLSSEDGHPGRTRSSVLAPYFPPAYRPASVRSYRISTSTTLTGSIRSTGPMSIDDSTSDFLPGTTDKTRAPGYYPAPVTDNFEISLAVASRSDGKPYIPLLVADEKAEETAKMRSVATDDKRILELLRRGASAPPMRAPDGEPAEDGPSAPHIDLDEHGFERPTENIGGPPVPSSPSRLPLDASNHRDLPAPPRVIAHRSFHSIPSDSSTYLDPFDELHLLPSAPPNAAAGDAPSAPPMTDEEDATASTHSSETGDESVGPDAHGSDVRETSPMSDAVTSGICQTSVGFQLGQPVILPRYEP